MSRAIAVFERGSTTGIMSMTAWVIIVSLALTMCWSFSPANAAVTADIRARAAASQCPEIGADLVLRNDIDNGSANRLRGLLASCNPAARAVRKPTRAVAESTTLQLAMRLGEPPANR